MRPYRGMTKEGRWVYGGYAPSGNKHFILESKEGAWIPWIMHEVISETVGQSTGLKDKNGKEVYGGHRYKYIGYEVRNNRQIRPKRIGEVRNDTPEHWIEDCHHLWCIITGNSQGTIEIIGNIHENPELSKDQK